jgi:acyl carrier protein
LTERGEGVSGQATPLRRPGDCFERGRMQTRDEVLDQIRAALVELFEIESERITPEARLNDDLEIDSIDAVDLLDRLRRQTGQKISADDFRSVRTVGDLVNAVHALVQV